MAQPVADFFSFVLSTSVVYILSGLGMVLSGRSGVFLVFNEGVMQASASLGFLIAYFTNGNLLLGLLGGAMTAALFGLLLAFFCITLKQNQFIVGLSLFIMGEGVANYAYKLAFSTGSIVPRIPTLQPVNIPILSRLPYIGPILFSQNGVFYFSVVLAVAIWYLLYKTDYGLKVRSVGERPRVADTLGINVFRTRYLLTIAGSALIGMAGAYLPFFYTGAYTYSLVNGRGWISIAVALLGGWAPIKTLFAALIFSGFDVFSIYGQLLNLPIPADFLLMAPFIATLAILIQVYRTAELPQALGKNYDRESQEE
ncbi:MAG: ABC transporter permease [Conexivisphaerales archaeon]